jgi:zinc protease
VKGWFTTYYGAANAVLVLAGDIDPETARQKVEKYFGDIPSGPPVTKHQAWIAKRSGEQRQIMEDRVPQARLYMVWNVPQWGSADADFLGLAANVLSAGKTSRLYERLVYDEQIATSVTAALDAREIASQFYIMAQARPGVELARIEKAIREELASLMKDGPTAAELDRVKTQRRAAFVRGVERIGGFGGKSDVLAQGEVYAGNPESYALTLKRVADATPAGVCDVASRWLSDGAYLFLDNGIRNQLFGGFGAVESRADHGTLFENLVFSELAKLTNPLLHTVRDWRSKAGAEVDFVIAHQGRILACEAKAGDARGRLSRSSMRFDVDARK